MERIDRWVGLVARYVDYVSRVGFFAMMALVTVNVILRYGWTSIGGTYDYVQLITAVSIGAAIAYTAYERGNIEIELLMERFPKRVQSIVASIMMFIALVFFALATWQVVSLAHEMDVKGETTMTAYVPFHPFLYWIAAGLGLMMIVMVVRLVRLILQIKRGTASPDEGNSTAVHS